MTVAEKNTAHDGSDYYWAKKTADEYRARGYEVILEATVDFLPGFRADIVARKDDDKRIVEVKRRSSRRADSRMNELARIIETQPGWSFDVVLIPESLQLVAPDGSRPIGVEAALHQLSAADRLLEAGYPESALLVAWAACEAVLRAQLQEETGTDDDMSLTSQLMDSVTMYGIISHEDRNYLKGLQALRNAVAHGYSHADVEDDVTLGLTEFVRNISTEAAAEATD